MNLIQSAVVALVIGAGALHGLGGAAAAPSTPLVAQARRSPPLARTVAVAQDTGRPPRLRIAADGRRIVQEDGTPFFWLGDSAWELFHRLNREQATRYLEDRARKGFNVIQAVILAELDGLHEPNAEGHTPLLNDDPTTPNEAYFEHVDANVDIAAELGMYVGMLPTWGDKFNRRWGIGPEVFTPENARAYGEFLGRRYVDDPIIWILGGDRIPESDQHHAIIRAMADGIRAASGGRQLITYHPMGGRKSWEWFHGDDWLDVHLFQSSHGQRDLANDRLTDEGYGLRPAKPVIDGEPRYEDHPIDWNPEEGWFEAFDIRQAAYWSVLAGAAGHTYGDHNIWQMWEPGREPVSAARTPWREALDHPGAAQMGYMKRLFLSRPFLDLVPDPFAAVSVAEEVEKNDGPDHIRVARDAHGRYLIAYTPYGRPIEIDLSLLSGDEVRAWWFDPRTGVATAIGSLRRAGRHSFDPPGDVERGNDWVLVIDDAAQGYAAPGTR
ncbi:MAG: glycoside hydrolase family 140 protein [Longimicrobiales bacterium]